MQEIVTVDFVTRLFLALAVLSPFLGLATAAILKARGLDRRRIRRIGLIGGLCGPANWLLWRLYNALTDLNGLDTVRNFGINLAVFLLIGLGLGLVLSRQGPQVVAEPVPSVTHSENTE